MIYQASDQIYVYKAKRHEYNSKSRYAVFISQCFVIFDAKISGYNLTEIYQCIPRDNLDTAEVQRVCFGKQFQFVSWFYNKNSNFI